MVRNSRAGSQKISHNKNLDAIPIDWMRGCWQTQFGDRSRVGEGRTEGVERLLDLEPDLLRGVRPGDSIDRCEEQNVTTSGEAIKRKVCRIR